MATKLTPKAAAIADRCDPNDGDRDDFVALDSPTMQVRLTIPGMHQVPGEDGIFILEGVPTSYALFDGDLVGDVLKAAGLTDIEADEGCELLWVFVMSKQIAKILAKRITNVKPGART